MIIDFHTHAFPDAIAQKTISFLADKARLNPYCDGTVEGLRKSSANAGIDYSVVLPIATKSGQEETINRFAADINNTDRIMSFGSIHPDTENYKAVLDGIKASGLKGIKLHPDYQDFYVDDERTYPMIEYAAKLGLIIVYHAGMDLGFRGPIKNTPVRAKKMIKAIGYDKIVMAHLGAHALYGDVMECLCGLDVYFDISFYMGKAEDTILKEIIYSHGADRILFGTDSPWGGQKEDIEYFNNLGFPEKIREKILYKNAMSLLQM